MQDLALWCMSGTGFFEPDSLHSCNYVLVNIWIWKCCWHCCQSLNASSLLSPSIIKFLHKDVWEIYNLTVESTYKIWEQTACQNRLWIQSSPTSNLRRMNYELFKTLLDFPFQDYSKEGNIQISRLVITAEILIATQKHFRGWFCVPIRIRSRNWELWFSSLYTVF